MEHKELLLDLLRKIECVGAERASAGTKYRLMGLAADIAEVTQTMLGVLEQVKHEAVLDVDVDTDYTEMSERLLALELSEHEENDCRMPVHTDEVREQIALVNEALGELSGVLTEISDQMMRRHTDEEFVRLYEAEKRRYLSSGTARRSRQTFEEWRENECYGHPTHEDIEDYRMEKVLQMFEDGVFNNRVEHIQRAKRYPGELNFDQLDDDHKMKKTAHRHYAALRKIVDYRDGCLTVIPARVGQHFYASRHEANAKSLRYSFLKHMHKVSLVQEERRRLLEAEAEQKPAADAEQPNMFAPAKNLKVLLAGDWFGVICTDEKRFDTQWRERFVDGLMATEWGAQIASDWAVSDKRLTLKCMVVGLLKDAGVVRGSYMQIAKLLELGDETSTLAKYMGLGKKQPYADWVTEQAATN